jgi:hypothetical protein
MRKALGDGDPNVGFSHAYVVAQQRSIELIDSDFQSCDGGELMRM